MTIPSWSTIKRWFFWIIAAVGAIAINVYGRSKRQQGENEQKLKQQDETIKFQGNEIAKQRLYDAIESDNAHRSRDYALGQLLKHADAEISAGVLREDISDSDS